MVVLTRAEVASLRPACKKDRLLNPQKYERIENVLQIMMMRSDSVLNDSQERIRKATEGYCVAKRNLFKSRAKKQETFRVYAVSGFSGDYDDLIRDNNKVIDAALELESANNERKSAIDTFVGNLYEKIDIMNTVSALKGEKKLDDDVLIYGK